MLVRDPRNLAAPAVGVGELIADEVARVVPHLQRYRLPGRHFVIGEYRLAGAMHPFPRDGDDRVVYVRLIRIRDLNNMTAYLIIDEFDYVLARWQHRARNFHRLSKRHIAFLVHVTCSGGSR